MQSKSSFSLRKFLPAPLQNNSGDDDPIGGSADIAMSAIETSLTALKEASALVSRVPYIGPIAGIILEALKMRDEVKQLKGEWGVVMQKLAKVGSILVDVGEWYQANDKKEDDLPSDLRNVLRSLQSDLDGIQDVLEQCAKVKGVRKVLLRTDILGKVKRYDAKLAHALQVFQARVTVGTRLALAQIVQERKVNSPSQTASSSGAGSAPVAKSRAPTPSDVQVAQVFFGRDAELAQIIEMIFANNESRAARIAILGPGGYGKTTLAHAALTHRRVREYYEDARYIVKCESLLSSGALIIELAKTLGVFKAGSDASWSRIRALLIAKECIICFDNFESPWDQPGDIKASVEEFLSRITEIHHVTIIITMRGTERPAKTQWTRPTLAPLKTLTLDAAKETWEHITDHYDDFAEKLINAVDCVPLAVNLLAHLAQGASAALVWHDWNEKCIQLVQLGYMSRLSNLEYSIQLSIDSERMRHYSFSKNLLGILSLLPDGIHIQQLERFKGIFNHTDFLSSLQVLQRCSLINLTGERYQTHPIIRLFCDTHGLSSSAYKTSLQEFYITLANYNAYRAVPKDYAEMVQAVTFLKQSQGSKLLLIMCLKDWGGLYYAYAGLGKIYTCQNKLDEAEAAFQKALKLNIAGNEPNNQGNDYVGLGYAIDFEMLGKVYFKQDKLNDAELFFQKALKCYVDADAVKGKKDMSETLKRVHKCLRRELTKGS
ncbi:P-loop containing nucleoside triphosphate hydrolase protein [Lactarius quietus]|nr:P-loop containing nucleoside triphosphate hydrolase protein [Lactarius quietus]